MSRNPFAWLTLMAALGLSAANACGMDAYVIMFMAGGQITSEPCLALFWRDVRDNRQDRSDYAPRAW